MSKRAKWLHRPEQKLPEHLRNYVSTGAGVPNDVVDRAFWLGDETAHLDPWITALEAIDKRGDKGPLLALLKSEFDLPREARVYLADLLARHQLKKKGGGQTTPAYDRTEVEIVLSLAIDDVRELVRTRKRRVAEALEQTSRTRGIPPNILESAYKDRRGSTRRMKKRRTLES